MSDERSLVPSTSAAPLGMGLEKLELPSKLVVTRGPGFFELTWRQKDQITRQQYFAPLFSSLGTMGVLVNVTRQWPIVGALMATLLFGCLGLAALAYAKNVTRVRVSQGLLAYRSGPIGGGDTEIVADDVVDIVAAPPIKARKDGGGWSVNVLFRAEPSQKPRRPKAIVGPFMMREQAEQIATILRGALTGETE